jgi:uncharacterized protein DUF6194
MNETQLAEYIAATFAGVETSNVFGYTFFFRGPDREMPFATIASADNDYDHVSNLDRPGVFRLNVGVGKDTYRAVVGSERPRPGAGVTGCDFTALDRIMPHPDYAAQGWVCVLNPSDATLATVQRLLAEAYAIAEQRQAKRDKV